MPAFPGEFAGASLKRRYGLCSGSAAFHAVVPRRIRRGLIEAVISLLHNAKNTVSVPRRIRRGLIEAESSFVGHVQFLPSVPRRIRRGLIEAASHAGELLPGHDVDRPFPGEFAGASLKPVFYSKTPSLRTLLPPFPGEFAGASLKPPSGADIGSIPSRVPRRIRRGLIEAPPTFVPLFPAAGFVPRRIRRGLIEAIVSGRSPIEKIGAFPGEFAGASLKPPRGACRWHRAPEAFPGEFAGASLKLTVGVRDGGGTSVVPRRIRRGLIEAPGR